MVWRAERESDMIMKSREGGCVSRMVWRQKKMAASSAECIEKVFRRRRETRGVLLITKEQAVLCLTLEPSV